MIKKRVITSLFLFLLLILTLRYESILLITCLILGVLSIIELFNLSVRIFKNKLFLFVTNLFFFIYIFLFCCFFVFMSSYLQFKFLLFLLLIGCIASDLGGYIFGKIFKGPKLTKISPNKTYSGAFGSAIFTIIIFLGFSYYLVTFPLIKIFFLAISTSILCQIGDLFVSFLKRKAKVKNTGNILPGHGGILDRLDGIFVGVPFGFLVFILSY